MREHRPKISDLGIHGEDPPGRSRRGKNGLEPGGVFPAEFDDGKAIQAKLAGIDRYNLVVVTRQNKLFVPKRSIKYIILKETATGPEASAEQPGAATGTSEVG